MGVKSLSLKQESFTRPGCLLPATPSPLIISTQGTFSGSLEGNGHAPSLNSDVAAVELFVSSVRKFHVRGASPRLRAFENEHFFSQPTTSTVIAILHPEANL